MKRDYCAKEIVTYSSCIGVDCPDWEEFCEGPHDFTEDFIVGCDHKDCDEFIKGYLGYNGQFKADGDTKYVDLRNVVWKCDKHSK